MSDAKLPAEGEMVLAWRTNNRQEAPNVLQYVDDKGWQRWDEVPGEFVRVPRWFVPVEWVPVSTAKAAGRLAEAARAVVEQWDTPNWKLVEPTAAKINAMRAVLDEID